MKRFLSKIINLLTGWDEKGAPIYSGREIILFFGSIILVLVLSVLLMVGLSTF